MVELSTIGVSYTPCDALWIFVYTFKSVPAVTALFCHQVSTVLQCPTRRADVPCWYNVEHRSSADVADGTWNVVIMHVWQGRASVQLILCPMQWTVALHSRLVAGVLGNFGQTESVGSTSLPSVESPCCNPLIDPFCPWHTRAGGPPPPDVHRLSSCWPWWTRRSLHPQIPLHSFLPIPPVSPWSPSGPWLPISSIPPSQNLNGWAGGSVVWYIPLLEGTSP